MSESRIFRRVFSVLVLLIVLFVILAILFIFLTPAPEQKTDNKVHIVYFYKPSCENCSQAGEEIERVNQSYPGRLEVTKIDITTPMDTRTSQIYAYYIKKFDLTPGMVPLVIINNTIYIVGADSVVPYFEGIVNGSIVVE